MEYEPARDFPPANDLPGGSGILTKPQITPIDGHCSRRWKRRGSIEFAELFEPDSADAVRGDNSAYSKLKCNCVRFYSLRGKS